MDDRKLTDSFVAILIVTLLSVIAYLRIAPGVGFDDANITMNYALNIANGDGYVYFVGGERVEGSTSALWTAINVILAFTGQLEFGLAAIGFLIACATIYSCIRGARWLTGDFGWLPVLFCGMAVLAFPELIVWQVWSYMDISLWCLLLLWLALAVTGPVAGHAVTGPKAFQICILAALVVLTRPEGIGFVLVAAFTALVLGAEQRRSTWRISLLLVFFGALAFAGVTLARLWYFDAPFPNTFYAKVSTSYAEQIKAGAGYVRQYLEESRYAVLIALAIGGLVVAGRNRIELRSFAILAGALFAGGTACYVLLGGDHFGSFRFMQFATPLLLVAAGSGLVVAFRQSDDLRVALPVAIAGLGLLVAHSHADFQRFGGRIEGELRRAEIGRAAGEALNDLPAGTSVSVSAAGGISMTFDGPIYDLLGLNWREMAMSDRDAFRSKNHSGFSADVFFDAPIDVIVSFRECPNGSDPVYEWKDHYGDLMLRDAFQAEYAPICWRGYPLFVRKPLLAGLPN